MSQGKLRDTALGKSEIVQEISQEKTGGMEHLDAIGHLPPITDECESKTATKAKGVVGK